MSSSMLQGLISSTCWPSPSHDSSFKRHPLLSQQAAAAQNCCSGSARAMAVAGRGGLFSSASILEEAHFGYSGRLCVSRGLVQSQRWQQPLGERPSRRRGKSVVTRALPADTYWITAFQAMAVAVLMGGIAVVTGILINIRIEVQAMEEYLELEKKGLLPEDMTIPDEDFEIDAPLYIFAKGFSSSAPPRNRPIREEVEPELKPEQMEPELETASRQD